MIRFIRSNDMLAVGIVLGTSFWFIETTIHTYIFQDGPFIEEMLPVDPNEFWMRTLVVFLLILFGIHAQHTVNRRRRAEEALKESEKELRILSTQLLTAQEDERARVSRELHEDINQYLCSIKFRMEEALDVNDGSPGEPGNGSTQNMAAMFQEVVEKLRVMSMALRPSTLDDLGIVATINSFTSEFQGSNPDIRLCERIEVEEKDIPKSLQIVIFRIMQEALKNAAKHSGADQATVGLRRNGGRLELSIEDNGTGFSWKDALAVDSKKRGTGLGSMKERTELSGGSFSIETGKNGGTVVRALWPV